MLGIYWDITCKDRYLRMFFEGMWKHKRKLIFCQSTWSHWCRNIHRDIWQHRLDSFEWSSL